MRLLVLPGDGIGPEITAASVGVLEAASRRFDLGLQLDHDEVGHASLKRHGTTVRPELLRSIRTTDGIPEQVINDATASNNLPALEVRGAFTRFSIICRSAPISLFVNERSNSCSVHKSSPYIACSTPSAARRGWRIAASPPGKRN